MGLKGGGGWVGLGWLGQSQLVAAERVATLIAERAALQRWRPARLALTFG